MYVATYDIVDYVDYRDKKLYSCSRDLDHFQFINKIMPYTSTGISPLNVYNYIYIYI